MSEFRQQYCYVIEVSFPIPTDDIEPNRRNGPKFAKAAEITSSPVSPIRQIIWPVGASFPPGLFRPKTQLGYLPSPRSGLHLPRSLSHPSLHRPIESLVPEGGEDGAGLQVFAFDGE